MEKCRAENCECRDKHRRVFQALPNGDLNHVDGVELDHAIPSVAQRCAVIEAWIRPWRFYATGITWDDRAVFNVAELLARNGGNTYAVLRQSQGRMDKAYIRAELAAHLRGNRVSPGDNGFPAMTTIHEEISQILETGNCGD